MSQTTEYHRPLLGYRPSSVTVPLSSILFEQSSILFQQNCTDKAISPDGERLFFSKFNDDLYLWDLESREELYRLNYKEFIMDIVIGPDGKLGLSPGSNNTVILPDLPFELEEERCWKKIWNFPRRCRRFHPIFNSSWIKVYAGCGILRSGLFGGFIRGVLPVGDPS